MLGAGPTQFHEMTLWFLCRPYIVSLCGSIRTIIEPYGNTRPNINTHSHHSWWMHRLIQGKVDGATKVWIQPLAPGRMLSHFKIVWRLVYGLLTAGQTILSMTMLIAVSLFIFACVAVENLGTEQVAEQTCESCCAEEYAKSQAALKIIKKLHSFCDRELWQRLV